MKIRHVSLAMLLLTGVVSIMASPAAAAPPGDDLTAPIVLRDPLPTTPLSIDTAGATASPDDPPDTWCWGGQLGATTFLSYAPEASRSIAVDYHAEDYDGLLQIFAVEDEGSLSTVAGSCYSGAFILEVTSGTEYLFMLAACCDPTATGGQTTIALREAPPPPEARVSVASASVNRRTGVVAVDGTVSCDPDGYFNLWGQITQAVPGTAVALQRDFYVESYEASCEDGTAHWRSLLSGAAFRNGIAYLELHVTVCDEYRCDDDTFTGDIRLRNRRLG